MKLSLTISLVFWAILGLAQNTGVFPSAETDRGALQAEVVDGQFYIIDQFIDHTAIAKINDLGEKRYFFDEAHFDGLQIFRTVSLLKNEENFICLTQFIDSTDLHYIGLLVLDHEFNIVEIRDTFRINGTTIFHYEYDKLWNPVTNRFEWILGISNGSFNQITSFHRIAIDDSGHLEQKGIVMTEPVFNFFSWVPDYTTGQYIVSIGKRIVVINPSFNEYQIYPIRLVYENVTTEIPFITMQRAQNGSLLFFSISTKKMFVISGNVLPDTILCEIVVVDYKDNDSDPQVLRLNQNDTDRTSFVTWSENLIDFGNPNPNKLTLSHHVDEELNYIRTLKIKQPGAAIVDIEYDNHVYYGVGVYFDQEYTNFYFIIPEDSEFITGAGDIEISIPDIVIYPNPTTSHINITGDLDDIVSYSISTSDGRYLEKNNAFRPTIEMEYPNGIYILTLKNGNGLFTSHRVVVK